MILKSFPQPDLAEPDDLEIDIASHIGVIPSCPLCGHSAILTSKTNPVTGLWVSTILCTNLLVSNNEPCGVNISSGGQYTRQEAQQIVINRWSRRT